MLPRRLLRIVSATLVVVLASLVSAAAVCLVPCELLPARQQTTGENAADHCAGTGASSTTSSVSLMADAAGCAAQHAWDVPAADRLPSRVAADLCDPPSADRFDISASVTTDPLSAARMLAPDSPPPSLAVPLRI